MEDLRLAATPEGDLQSLETEGRLKAVRELPTEHVPGEQIHNRHQVEKTFLQRDVGDVGRPELIHPGDLFEAHQAGKPL